MKNLGALALIVTSAACATSGMNASAGDISALEQKVSAQPNNADLTTSLGIAYYNAKRYDDAVKTLSTVDKTSKNAGAATLYLGLANEELKNWTAARQAYEAYLTSGSSKQIKDRIRGRLALVAREELKSTAKATIAREQQLSTEAPTPRTVAVMPFQMVGTNPDLAPLQTALTDMIITDLSVSPALVSVERVKVKAMIDEMLIAQSGLSEQGTGARVGHLLKAEHVVQGVIAQSGDKDLRLDATVLTTTTSSPAGTFGQNQQVDAIFDLEKQTVFSIFNTLGVTLTAQEREKINENRTGNLLAFLAYGRGLTELDRGNYQQATTYFRQATQLDPNFTRAAASTQQSAQLQQASTSTTAEVATAAAPTEAPQVAAAATTNLLNNTLNDVNPTPATTTTQTNTTTQQNNSTNQSQNQSGNPATSQGTPPSISQATKATIVIQIKKPGT